MNAPVSRLLATSILAGFTSVAHLSEPCNAEAVGDEIEAKVGLTTIRLQPSASGADVLITQGDAKPTVKAFTLPEPPRLVIDVPRADNTQTSRIIPVPKSDWVQRMRIAAHDNKLRIVLDLAKSPARPLSLDTDSGLVRISTSGVNNGMNPRLAAAAETGGINESVAKPSVAAASNRLPSGVTATQATALQQATADAKVAANAHEVQTSTRNHAGLAETSGSDANLETARARLAPSDSTVEESPRNLWGITFVSLTPSLTKAVRLDLSTNSEFSLTRRDETNYVLAIPQTTLKDPSLSLPFFPPRDFEGFTVLLAKQVGVGVEITIGVDKGTEIVAAPKDKSIWLKAVRTAQVPSR